MIIIRSLSVINIEPINIIPAAISAGKSKTFVNVKPKIGMIINWKKIPIPTFFGVLSIETKSSGVMVVPMPNMMICNTGIMSAVSLKSPTEIKYCGKL